MKKIYLVRHCETVSQDRKSPLTEKGYEQAGQLAHFFTSTEVDAIISSPFMRARESIEPLAEMRNIEIIEDERLAERVLSSDNLPDWYEKLSETFTDLDRTYEGGESSREAMKRIVDVIEEVRQSGVNNAIVVTHGNVLALLLHHYDHTFGFEQWEQLRNPDVFVLKSDMNGVQIQNVWK